MNAYHELARSYDRLTNDVDYAAVVDFYREILKKRAAAPGRRWTWPAAPAL